MSEIREIFGLKVICPLLMDFIRKKVNNSRKNSLSSVVRSLTVGNTLSLALNDTNNANGTIHKQIVK